MEISALAEGQLKGFAPAGYQFFAQFARRKENRELIPQASQKRRRHGGSQIKELANDEADSVKNFAGVGRELMMLLFRYDLALNLGIN